MTLSLRPTDNIEEKALLRLLVQKDPEALERLYAAYQRRLLLTAWHVLGHDDAEAEDAVQETFIHAVKDLPRTEIHTSLYGWLNRVCVSRCIDIIRGRRKMLARQSENLEVLGLALAHAKDRNREQDEESRLAIERVHRAVALLDEPCRSLVHDRDIDGVSYIDLAKKYQLALGTVMSRLSRCRETLKKKLLLMKSKEKNWPRT